MILHLLYKPARYKPLVEVEHLNVSPDGIVGEVPTLWMRQVLIVPSSTLDEFHLLPGDLRENLVVEDSHLSLHALPSGTVLRIGDVQIRLTVHCEPCGRLKNVVSSRAVEHKRGYLGMFLTAGRLRRGDAVMSLGKQFEAIPYDLKKRLAWFLENASAPVEVTRLVGEVGLSLSYCRAIPSLLRGRSDLLEKVIFNGGTISARRQSSRDPRAQPQLRITDITARALEFVTDGLVIYLQDERSFTVPLGTIPALTRASVAQRDSWELSDDCLRIRWPNLGLDFTISSLLGLPD